MVGSVSGLFLLDGNSLIYRAFFAIPRDMVTASGQETNAVFGFTQMLISLLLSIINIRRTPPRLRSRSPSKHKH